MHRVRVIVALIAVGLLAGCGSGEGGGGTASGTSTHGIPHATARWSNADAVTIAHHIPGCASIDRLNPRNDEERRMASIATCKLGDATVTIEDAPPNLIVDLHGTAPGRYVIGGYGWLATVDDKAAAERVAAALGGRVTQ